MQDQDKEPDPSRRTDSLPQAKATPPRRFSISIVWVVPLVAALIGGWLAVKAVLEQGPVITIVFKTGEGLEPGKTPIKYRDVEVGKITDVALSHDRNSVIATAELRGGTDDWLMAETRFWVVRPRVVAGSVSGLGTLVSGAYVGMDVGKSGAHTHEFHGLDVPPLLTSDRHGRRFVLKGEELGSLDIGSPVYFRHIGVGQVLGYELDPDGKAVTLQVFIESPYDRFVQPNSRFWHASGVDLSVSANGFKLDTESLVSIAIGGLAFASAPGPESTEPVPENAQFTLYPNREEAMAPPKAERHPFVMYFNESLRGLTVGAPLDFRGINVGEVTGIRGEWDRESQQFRIAVDVGLSWGGVAQDKQGKRLSRARKIIEGRIERMVDSGLRAQLRTGNLISGQLYIALDTFADRPPFKINWSDERPEFPTMPGALQSLAESGDRIMKKLERLPLEQTMGELRQAVKSLDATLRSTEKLVSNLDRDLRPEMKTTLVQASRTLGAAQQTLSSDGALQQDARSALAEVARAAQSLRVLTDFLERHPESLLLGKEKGP